jgi:hypothetical protein
MRTTLTLEDDIAQRLQEKARRTGESFKEVVNETLRRGLYGDKPPSQPARFEVKAKACGFRSDVDVLHLNQVNDELEIEDFRRKLAASSAKP